METQGTPSSKLPPSHKKSPDPFTPNIEDVYRQNCLIINMLTILQGDIDKQKKDIDTIQEVVLDMSHQMGKVEESKGKEREEEETPRVPRKWKDKNTESYEFSLFNKGQPSSDPASWLFNPRTEPIVPQVSFATPAPDLTTKNLASRLFQNLGSMAPQAPPATQATNHKIKLKLPEPLKTTKSQEAKKWLYLLTQIEGEAGDWAYTHLGELANPNITPTIYNLKTFGEEFVKAFADPNEEQVAARKIVELTQEDVESKSTNKYATKFKTLAAKLNWNEAAFMAQFSKGLHWKTKEILSQCERQPTTLKGLMDTTIIIDNVQRENEALQKKEGGKEKDKGKGKASRSTPKGATSTSTDRVPKEEIEQHKEWGLCIKCGHSPHRATKCRTGWDSTPAKNPADKKKETKKETAKVL